MKRIPFDIQYRPEIESGKYNVITQHDHLPVRVICWDRERLGHPDSPTIMYLVQTGREEICFNYTREECAKSLEIVTDIPKLTEFEENVKNCLAFNYGISFAEDETFEVLKSTCESLRKLAEEDIRKKAMDSVKMYDYEEDSDLAKNAIGELTVCGFINNRSREEIADWLKDVPLRLYFGGNVAKLPTWKKAYKGTHFTGLAITMDPSGKDYPRLTGTAETDCEYIELNELFNLPKNK